MRNIEVDLELLDRLLKIRGSLLLVSSHEVDKKVVVETLANNVVGGGYTDRIEYMKFDSNTTYNDFIGGYQNKGRFSNFCAKVDKDREHKYVFIIDEIDSINIWEVLGEARTGMGLRGSVITTNGGFKLVVPPNIYIIATMNTDNNFVRDNGLRHRFIVYELDRKK